MNLLSTFLALLMAGYCMAAAPSSWSAEEREIAEKQIFYQLNQERQNAGLPALEWNEQAAQAARRHAQALVENGQLSHQFPGEPSLLERIGATGARFTLAAENVARTEYVEDVHPALMNSPGHRANILNS
ncbi:MAG TPA: CAP domain-containing protein, partial [Verrucomicrobiae bacterium]|nr:CAP domain-containing protein [Verrucomicrobiae bacterium]